mgnify:CR=1 FL=1
MVCLWMELTESALILGEFETIMAITKMEEIAVVKEEFIAFW